MKKILLSGILIIAMIMLIILIYNNCKISKLNAVVVKVNENSIDTMIIDENNKNLEYTSLCSVRLVDKENIGFQKGQELLIYYDGMIEQTYPLQISRNKEN